MKSPTLIFKIHSICLIALLVAFSNNLYSQRIPVLSQIDLPHSYYFRELYIPQLTSGPLSATWSPDSKKLVFSMGGSLWIQEITSQTAIQLTDDSGYDYQPDWSPEGNKIIFVRNNGQSIELMLLELSSGKTTALTTNNAVNLEPTWSPDGQSIAFVSTVNSGHFLLQKAKLVQNKLDALITLTPDRKSAVKRYYYSAYDHAINPTWAPDGKKIYFVSNKEIAHGTGNIVSMSLDNLGVQSKIHNEETAWRTKPAISPDGSRMVYSSYLGRSWNQLWLLPTKGGYPIQITYGDYDNINPSWSPDGKNIAFISNREGNTSLWIVDAYTGEQQQIITRHRKFIKPRKNIIIKTQDTNGNPIPARVSVIDSQGKFYASKTAWIHGDDAIYPKRQKFESHYFHSSGITVVSCPLDAMIIQAQKGPDYNKSLIELNLDEGSKDTIRLTMEQLQIPQQYGEYWSGDLHVHINYGGNYRNKPENLRKQANAENLNFIYNLIVNKEQRIPDISYFVPPKAHESKNEVMILQGQEYHTSFWGHLGLLNLTEHYILPDYVGYPYTAVASLFPHNSFIADAAHKQNGIVGYVHPFLDYDIFPRQSETLNNALPVDAALGNIYYYELIGFAHHKASEAVWYKLLNCGLRIPAGAGTDAMANYSSLRGPIGLNRVYIKKMNDFNSNSVVEGIKSGRSFVTNGPLIGLKVDQAAPGDIIETTENKMTFNFESFLRSAISIEHLELIWNGEVIKKYKWKEGRRNVDFKGTIQVEGSGWLLLRAWNSEAHPDIPDCYPYASTSPIYVRSKGKKISSKSSANYFIAWINRLEKAATTSDAYRSEEERTAILKDLSKALQYYESCLLSATID